MFPYFDKDEFFKELVETMKYLNISLGFIKFNLQVISENYKFIKFQNILSILKFIKESDIQVSLK